MINTKQYEGEITFNQLYLNKWSTKTWQRLDEIKSETFFNIEFFLKLQAFGSFLWIVLLNMGWLV